MVSTLCRTRRRPRPVPARTLLLLLFSAVLPVFLSTASASNGGATLAPASPGGVEVDAVHSGSTDTDNLTLSHTTSGTNRLMVVGVSINNDNFETVVSVTYNGVGLDFLGSVDNADDARVELWKLVNPDPGTHDVVIDFNANLTWYAVAGVITLTGVDPDTPLGPIASRFADGNAPDVTIPSASGELALGVFSCETCTSVSIVSPGTERWNVAAGVGGEEFGAGGTQAGTDPDVTISALLGSSDHWAAAGVSIKPLSVAGFALPPWSTWFFAVLLAAAGGLGALAWWRRRQRGVNVEEVFVVDKGGTLLAHRSCTILQDNDEDLVVAMFTAIQEYVRNVFSKGTEERIRSLEFGERKIIIERGRNYYVAVVFRGREPKSLERDLKELSQNIDRQFGKVLEQWHGDTERVGGIALLIPQVWTNRRS